MTVELPVIQTLPLFAVSELPAPHCGMPLFGESDIDDSDDDPTSVPRCSCDWTYHRGRTCGNPLPAPSSAFPTQLCLPCLFSCQAEREEAEDTP